MVHKAGTLLIPSGTQFDADIMHLHIVCTDPCSSGMQLIVSVSTWTNHYCDGSCILEAEDHEFIRHKSWVMYRKTRVEAAATLDNGVETGIFKVKSDMESGAFERVCAGILASPHTPRKMKAYYRVRTST